MIKGAINKGDGLTFKLTNYQGINLYKESIDIPLLVNSVSITNCYVDEVPGDFFSKFLKLEKIDMSHNFLKEFPTYNLPTSVTCVKLSNNKLHEFIIPNNSNINTLILDQNKETINIIDMRKGNKKYIEIISNCKIITDKSGGNIENGLQEEIEEGLIINSKLNTNVHSKAYEDITFKYISKLFSKETFIKFPYDTKYVDGLKNYYKNMLENRKNEIIKKHNSDNLFTKCLKTYIIFLYPTIIKNNYKFIKSIYDVENKISKFNYMIDKFENIKINIYYDNNDNYCTLGNILERIWSISKYNINIDNIFENLYYEMEDSYMSCFSGIYTRLINSISLFYGDICVNIPFNELFINKLETLRKNTNYTSEKIYEDMLLYIQESNLSVEEKIEWSNSLCYL